MKTAVDERDLEIDKRITGNGSAHSGFKYSFLDRRAEVLGHRSAKDLVHPHKAFAALQRFENYLAVPELPASAGLLFMTALDLGLLRDRFLVRNLRRM